MDVSEMQNVLVEKIADLQESIKFLEKNREIFENCPFRVVESGRSSRIIITKLSDLRAAREIMGKLYGSWRDKYGFPFYSQGVAIATWKDPRYDWSIWIECSIEDFPKELLKSDTCKWVETTSRDYYVVCNS